ncbi:MAG: purine-nucleoside phosphorylase [Acutalibacteraceae bacterium]|jgi:purine-nucleoside phosphorylase
MVDVKAIAAAIRTKTALRPKIGIVLGSGLGGLADRIERDARVSYAELPGFPRSTVEGHKGEYLFGRLDGVPVVLMNGRVHAYEGYAMDEVVAPARVMALLGVDTVILTNAAGGLNERYRPGTLMAIADQISSFVPSPLIGPNDPTLGTRFPDMSAVYDPALRDLLHQTAAAEGIALEDGVYLQITGPAYETPAESRLYAALGADAVGMSTACEAVALRHMGVRLLGLSCITDMAIHNDAAVTTHEQVQQTAAQAADRLIRLVRGTVARIAAAG